MAHRLPVEVIDDSEPEREELRLRQRDRYLRGRSPAKKSRATPINIMDGNPGSLALSVLREVDDHGEVLSGPNKNTELLNSNKHDYIPLQNEARGYGGATPTNTTQAYTLKTRLMPLPRNPSPESIPNVNDTESDSEDENPTSSLARFAFLGKSASVNIAAKNLTLTRQASSVSITAEPKVQSKKKSTHRFVANFSDVELGRLAKCISCGIHWTTRKTAAQKMLHIQSCAKKMTFSDETIRILITQEIDSYKKANPESRGKGKLGASVDLNSKTYLEDVLAESAPKKKSRRVQCKETVKNIEHTRNHILGRARVVIGVPPSLVGIENSEPSFLTQTAGATRSHFDSSFLPPTQAFGESALAQHHHQKTHNLFSRVRSNSDDSDDGILPFTQKLAPSKLGSSSHLYRGLLGNSSHISPPQRLAAQTADIISGTSSFPEKCDAELSTITSCFIPSGASTRDLLHPVAQRTRGTTTNFDVSPVNIPSLTSASDDNHSIMFCNNNRSIELWDNDDAYLHFVSELGETPDPTVATPYVSMHTTIASDPHPGKKTTPSKAKAKKPVELFNDAWEIRMKEKILRNANLHLRVLRYEPIDIDVFLQLALEDSSITVSGKLRLRLRSFLDKQAIHFYGAEPSTGRGRR